MPSDLVIRGATVVLPGVFPVEADVAIEGEQIAAIGHDLEAREEIDARGLHLFPGVDRRPRALQRARPHALGGLGDRHAARCAAGGATACIEMPLNAHPPTIDGAAFDAKVAAATASSLVDFALWGGLVPGNLDRLDELAERGVVGFKAFMCDSGIEDFPAVDDEVLEAGMQRAAALGLPVAVHAERPSALREPAGTTWRDFVASRPVEAELEAIEVALELAERTGCSLHVVHVSSARGRRARGGQRRDVRDLPALPDADRGRPRDARHARQVRAAAAARRRARRPVGAPGSRPRSRFVASDHSPCPPEMKAGDFTAAWGGIAGAQATLGLLLERLPPQTVAALTSANPARRFNLPKGRLEPGADADLVLVDLRDRRPPELQDRHKLSPFAGRPLPRIVRTLVRGGASKGRLITPRKDTA